MRVTVRRSLHGRNLVGNGLTKSGKIGRGKVDEPRSLFRRLRNVAAPRARKYRDGIGGLCTRKYQ